jgi:hypothetical protein
VAGTISTSVKNTVSFKLVEYYSDGSVRDIKNLDDSVFSCVMNGEDIVKVASFGLSMQKNCTRQKNFNVDYYYDVYVETSDGSYA